MQQKSEKASENDNHEIKKKNDFWTTFFLRGVVQWITKKLQCLDDKMDRNNQKKMDRNRL